MATEQQHWRAQLLPGSIGETVDLPRMWYVFVFGCLVFSVFIAGRLIIDFPGLPLLALGIAGLAAIVGLFLWTTLRHALTAEDLAPSGLSASTINRRLLLILGMLLLNHALIPLLDYQLWWLFAYAMVAAGLALPLVQAKILIFGLTALSMAHNWYFEGGFQPILLSLAVLSLGAVIIRVLTITNIELEASRNDAARLAVAEERLRFARDLHDSLGQSLSTIVLKSELGHRVIGQDAERAAHELRDVEQVARESLAQVRSVVTGYRQPSLSRELAGARTLLEAAGVTCHVRDETEKLPPAVEQVLAWGVREGVTNVVRHSDATSCTISIVRENGTARLELTDNGSGPNPADLTWSTGTGLRGLSERIADAGGWLSAGSSPDGGFRLVLEAPAGSTA